MTDHNKPADQNPQQQQRQQRYSFWDSIINRFSTLSLSVIEIILKTILTFAILLCTVIGVSIAAFIEVIYYLPLSFVVAATLCLIFIWKNTNRALASENLESLKTMQKRLNQLYKISQDQEKRLKNIEIVESFEDRLARQQLDREDSNLNEKLASKVPLQDSINTTDEPSESLERV